MTRPSKSEPKVSVSFELSEIEKAVEGVQIALEDLGIRTLVGSDTGRTIRNSAALLTMVVARLRHFRRAVSGAVSPREILASHNAVSRRAPADDPDILLGTLESGSRRGRFAEPTARGGRASHQRPHRTTG